MDKDAKEPTITAHLEIIEDEVKDREPEAKTPTLTAEQIAALEAEKALLLGDLRAKAAAAPRPAPTPVEVPDVYEPVVVTSEELDAATIAVEAADAELRALAEEERLLDVRRAEALAADQATHNARRAALREKLALADAEKQRLERLVAGIHLKMAAEQAQIEATRERVRQQASLDAKADDIRKRVQPGLTVAKRVLAELQQIAHEHLATLESLGRMTWQDTPAVWPADLRKEFQQTVAVVAGRYARELHDTVASLRTTVEHATQLVAGWEEAQRVPTEDWDGYMENFEQKVTRIVRRLALAADYVHAVRGQLAEVDGALTSIQERGGHLTDLVKAGEIPAPEPLKAVLNAEERANIMIEARLREGVKVVQTHAETRPGF